MSAADNYCGQPGANPGAPAAIAPGSSAFSYRVGTYGSFFAAMMQQLSNLSQYPALTGLKTRELDDPAIALCDAWAVVADVLTFYQERIANEGYVRTATERRSIIELGRLSGYVLRPGVAANVYLAYTMSPGSAGTVGAGQRVQSVPPPGSLPQTFETAEAVTASDNWNNLPPRLTRPQVIAPAASSVYAKGITTNLKKNDPVLLMSSGGAKSQFRRIAESVVQAADKRTLLQLQPPTDSVEKLAGAVKADSTAPAEPLSSPFKLLVDLIGPLSRRPAAHPLNAQRLKRQMGNTLATSADMVPSLLKAFSPDVADQIYAALQAGKVAPDPAGELHALRVQAAPFGSNAPKKPILDEKGVVIGTEEWPLGESIGIRIVIDTSPPDQAAAASELRIGSLRLSVARHKREIGISIEKGSIKASAAMAMPTQPTTIAVGNWSVTITPKLDATPPSIDFQFADPITRDISIALKDSFEAVEVNVDDAPPITIAHGLSSSSSSAGAQIFVSYLNAILVQDERAEQPDPCVVYLDAVHDEIVPGSWVAIERPDSEKYSQVITSVAEARQTSVARYGLQGRVTRLKLKDPWLDKTVDLTLAAIRAAVVCAQSEKLALVEVPIKDEIASDTIELGGLYGGLQSGRWLVVAGQRTDVPGAAAAELVMLDSVVQDVSAADGSGMPLSSLTSSWTKARDAAMADDDATVMSTAPSGWPGDSTHSFLKLVSGLGYHYQRDTVTVYGNVTRATNGETRIETLGSGDATIASQSFLLRSAPLTYVSAPTASGAQSSLVVTVNDVAWTEVDSLAAAGPKDRVFVTSTNDAHVATVLFGDGIHGSRLPTGVANVKAQYRSGIGTQANVGAGEISLLVTRPSGVKAVVNPMPGSGGADPESRDVARSNLSTGLMTLSRLVSVADYAALARTFAGVAKADAAQLQFNGRPLIAVTIAGLADAPVPDGSDLMINLVAALQQASGGRQVVEVKQRELILVVAAVTLTPSAGVLWESLVAKVRAALVDAFGFDRRALGQSLALSEFAGVIHGVPGVAAATIAQFDGISQADAQTPSSLQVKLTLIAGAASPTQAVTALPARLDPLSQAFLPAQLVILSPDIADTLILSQAS